ncbi:MAG: hypothetical protein ACI9WC_000962 [Arenicella sp.]|jgi:hypothetical protein
MSGNAIAEKYPYRQSNAYTKLCVISALRLVALKIVQWSSVADDGTFARPA